MGALEYDAGQLESVEIAGPGFINFRFAASWLYDALNGALQQGSGFGKSTLLKGKRYQVEFVSANPTGPLYRGSWPECRTGRYHCPAV